jgi:hypothetical protein
VCLPRRDAPLDQELVAADQRKGVNFGPSIGRGRPRRDAVSFEPKTVSVSRVKLLAGSYVALVQLHRRDSERGGQFFELHDVQATLSGLDFADERRWPAHLDRELPLGHANGITSRA